MTKYFDNVEDAYNKSCKQIALFSFYLGVLVFIIFLLSVCNFVTALLGIYYVGTVALINGGLILGLIINYFLPTKRAYKQETLITILISLCNIPIALVFMYLGIVLLAKNSSF